MPLYKNHLNLSQNEIRNAVVHRLDSAPTNPAKGQIYYDNITDEILFWDGSSWVSMAGGGGGGAPTDAQYVTLALNGTLSQERVLTAGTALSLLDSGANNNVTLSVVASGIPHDSLSGVNTNQHIDHTTVTITAGAGLSGGGDISASRTIDVDIAGETQVPAASGDLVLIADVSDSNNIKSSTVASILSLDTDSDPDAIHDNVAGEISAITAKSTPASGDYFIIEDSEAGDVKKSVKLRNIETTLRHDELAGFVTNEHIDHSSVTLSAGEGLSGGGDITASRSFALDLNELETLTTIASGDKVPFTAIGQGNANRNITFLNLQSRITHNNLLGLTTGDPHTQYIYTTPEASTRNVIDSGPSSSKTLLRFFGHQGLGGQVDDFIQIFSDAGTTKIAWVDSGGKIFGAGIDARGERITNVANPTATGDAVNQLWFRENQGIHGIRTLSPSLVGKYIDARTHGNLTGSGTTAATPSANRLTAWPIWIPATDRFDRIAINVTTAGGGIGELTRLGIYEDNEGVPGALVVDAGTVAVDSTGLKEITINVELTGGRVYWLAYNTNGTAGYFGYSFGGGRNLYYDSGNDTSVHRFALYRSFTFAAFPNPFGAITGLEATILNIRLRIA